jgi:hypothetical protein
MLVDFTVQEQIALRRLAWQEKRTPRNQAAVMIRSELKRSGLLTVEIAESESGTGDELPKIPVLATSDSEEGMTLPRAVRLAVEAMRLEVKRLAFNANIADRLKVTAPEAMKASKRRRELLNAITLLSDLKDKQGNHKQRLSNGKTQVQIQDARA